MNPTETMPPQQIRQLRKRLGWTQDRLGRYLGYAHPIPRVSELERGIKKPSRSVVRLLEMLEDDKVAT